MKNSKYYFLIILCLFLIDSILAQQPQAENSEKDKSETPEVLVIPIGEVTSRANQDYFLIEKIKANLLAQPAISSIDSVLPSFIDSLKVLRKDSIYQKLADLPPRTLQGLAQEWGIYLKKFDSWNSTISIRIASIEEENSNLHKIITVWENTEKASKKEKIPKVVLESMELLLDKCDTVNQVISAKYEHLLEVQTEISNKQIDIKELIELLRETENKIRNNIFVMDSPPIWDIKPSNIDSTNVISKFSGTINVFVRSNYAFVIENISRFVFHLFLFLILSGIIWYTKSWNLKNKIFNEKEKSLKASVYFFSKPFSAGLLLSLFLSIIIYPVYTVSFAEFIKLLLIIPIMRLAPGFFDKTTIKWIAVLAVTYFLLILYKNSVSFLLLQRLILLFVTLIYVIGIIWWLWAGKIFYKQNYRSLSRTLLKFALLVLFLLVISIIANIVGYVLLASKLSVGLIESLYILTATYMSVRVMDGIMIVFVRKKQATASEFLKTYAEQLEVKAQKLIRIVAFIIWLRASLNSFGILDQVKEYFSELLEYTWEIGQVTVSLNHIFDFFLILIITFVFSRWIGIILGLEIFPRLKLPRGIPGAITTVIKYFIVGLGIFLAISTLGFDMNKLSLMAGALGVGIGFGLQNIIANFISGLILTFERPVQIGDSIETGVVSGNVKRIGVRSSIIQAFDGSEVIVPNASLISDNVTNWTLSDTERRIKLPVKVAFGADPHEVIKILVNVANKNEEVLTYPEPFATFNGFGDYFLDFTLFYWISQNILNVQSDIALGVHDAIKAQGINTPIPQRDLNLRGFEKIYPDSEKKNNKTE